jgi:hypothetical protein
VRKGAFTGELTFKGAERDGEVCDADLERGYLFDVVVQFQGELVLRVSCALRIPRM